MQGLTVDVMSVEGPFGEFEIDVSIFFHFGPNLNDAVWWA
jgi:hypothetical protein